MPQDVATGRRTGIRRARTQGRDQARHRHGAAHLGRQAGPQTQRMHASPSRRRLASSAQSSTQDLGTGQRTVTALIVAEILGLEPERDLTCNSATARSAHRPAPAAAPLARRRSPATLRAAEAARDELPRQDRRQARMRKPDRLCHRAGQGRRSAPATRAGAWKQACARLGMNRPRATPAGRPRPSCKRTQRCARTDQASPTSGVGGVQIAEVMVDTETGVVRCTHDLWPCRIAA